MRKRYHRSDEAALAAQLKAEADADVPRYSSLLHERIMRRIRGSEVRIMERRGGWLKWGWGLAVAAGIVLALWIWGGGAAWFGHEGQRPVEVVQTNVPPVPAVEEYVHRTAVAALARLDAKIDEGKLAYLDEDAMRLARFVLDQASVLPFGR